MGERVIDIQISDLERFFEENHIPPAACPVCQHNGWGYIHSPISTDGMLQNFSLVLTSTYGHTVFPQGLPLVLLVCDKCGFVRPHLREAIEKFLNRGHDE